jgi:hypothetical protein
VGFTIHNGKASTVNFTSRGFRGDQKQSAHIKYLLKSDFNIEIGWGNQHGQVMMMTMIACLFFIV